MHVCAHTHTIIDRSHMCTNSVIYRTRAYPESHTCTHTIIAFVHPGCTHTHTVQEVTSPSLPVACTRRSSGVRGCTFGRRELAGRPWPGQIGILLSTLWPPVGYLYVPTTFTSAQGQQENKDPPDNVTMVCNRL